jgi:hypothetical protein
LIRQNFQFDEHLSSQLNSEEAVFELTESKRIAIETINQENIPIKEIGNFLIETFQISVPV